MLDFIEELEYRLKDWGASFTGFSDVKDKLPESLSKLPYAVTVGIRLSDAIIDEIEAEPTFTYFNHYRSVNALIDQICLKGMLWIQERGFKAYTIAASQSVPTSPLPFSGVFPHKTGAVMAGLGWVGKNGLFVHESFGPRVRLGTILTDMELPVANMLYESRCGECSRCADSCPAMALTGREWTPDTERSDVVDAKACSEYMNRHFKHIGRGSVCGICVKVCPACEKS